MPLKDCRLLEAAEGYLMLEMPDQALKSLSEIIDPQFLARDIDKQRGEAYRQKKDYEEALRSFFRIDLDTDPDLEVMIGIAWCYKRTNRLDYSIKTMEIAYDSFPEEPIVLYNIACYYSLAGEKELTLSWLGRALRMEGSLRKLIPDETDFDALRHDADFKFVVRKTDKEWLSEERD